MTNEKWYIGKTWDDDREILCIRADEDTVIAILCQLGEHGEADARTIIENQSFYQICKELEGEKEDLQEGYDLLLEANRQCGANLIAHSEALMEANDNLAKLTRDNSALVDALENLLANPNDEQCQNEAREALAV